MSKMKNTILFCGDIMPGGVLPYQKHYISEELLDVIKKADVRIGTLEAAIGDDFTYDEDKMAGRCNIVYAKERDFHRLVDMGINVVSIANNHVFDLGYDGFQNTIRLLEQHNIKYCGAGRNIYEAKKPAILHIADKTLAIHAYCMYGSKYIGLVPIAGEDTFGINPLDIDCVVADIKESKTKYDYVVLMPHWGKEYTMCPLDVCRKMAFQMIDAGADAVIGSHPHIIQPVIKYKGKYIAFCLGNFLFPDFYMTPPRPIWYPDSEKEVENIKRVVGYPFPIEEPVMQIWNDNSRIGLSLECVLEKNNIKINNKYYSKLTDENVIQFITVKIKYKIKLLIFTLIAKYGIFNTLYKFYNSNMKSI